MEQKTYRPSRHSSSRQTTRKRNVYSSSPRGRHHSSDSQSTTTYRRSGGSNAGRQSRFSRKSSTSGRSKMASFDPSQFINKNPVSVVEELYTPKHAFSDFGLDKTLVSNVISKGLSTPSPIQDQIIPHILKNKDVIGLAQTGTGKTAAFLLPLIHKTLHEPSRLTLVLAPTRELAIQIEDELRKFSTVGGTSMYATVCVGGTSIHPQVRNLKRKNHFIIGTPGRVLDLIERGDIQPKKIRTVVLDEADRMLDMGFIHDMRKILEDIPPGHETLFFSATMSKEIEKLVHDFLNDPVTVSVRKKDVTDSIMQDVVPYHHHDKFVTLTSLLSDPALKRVLVFGSMKHSVEKLSHELTAAGIKADAIHGNKSHGQRQQALKRFKSGNVRVLVATDVAARGIHVDNVTHVINYDLPNTFEDYVHRIGRTGRGTEKGIALTFVPTT